MDGLMSQRATIKKTSSATIIKTLYVLRARIFRALTRRSTFGEKLAKLKIIR